MLKAKYRNKEYIKFIKGQKCAATLTDHEIVAHHVRLDKSGGVGLKPSDYKTIPLTDKQHVHLHQVGESYYFNKNNIDPFKEIAEYLFEYFENQVTEADSEKVIEVLETAIEGLK